MEQNSQNIVLINNSRTTWPTYDAILSSNFFWTICYEIICQKGVDYYFEIEHKTC